MREMKEKYLVDQEYKEPSWCTRLRLSNWFQFYEKFDSWGDVLGESFLFSLIGVLIGMFIGLILFNILGGNILAEQATFPKEIAILALIGGLLPLVNLVVTKLLGAFLMSDRTNRLYLKRTYPNQLFLVDEMNRQIELLDKLGAYVDIRDLVRAKQELLDAVDAAREREQEVCTHAERECSTQTAKALLPITEELVAQARATVQAIG